MVANHHLPLPNYSLAVRWMCDPLKLENSDGENRENGNDDATAGVGLVPIRDKDATAMLGDTRVLYERFFSYSLWMAISISTNEVASVACVLTMPASASPSL